MAWQALIAAGKLAANAAKSAFVQKAKDSVSHFFHDETGKGLSVASWGTFGLSFTIFILMLAFGAGTAGELTGVNNPREPLAAMTGCGALDDPNTVSIAGADAFLTSRNSPLAGTGVWIVGAAQEFRVNPALMIGISNAESSLGRNGRAVPNKNPGNIKTSDASLQAAGFQLGVHYTGHDDQNHVIFTDWRWGWRGLAEVLRRNYLNQGRTTLESIAEIYLEGNKANWIANVSSTMAAVCEIDEPGDCGSLVDAGGLTYSHANDRDGLPQGAIARRAPAIDPPEDPEGELVPVNQNICDSVLEMVNAGIIVNLNSVVGTHPKYVAGSNPPRISSHWVGSATDTANSEAIAKFIFDNRARFHVDQIITGAYRQYNVNNGQPYSGYSETLLESHAGHIHIGF